MPTTTKYQVISQELYFSRLSNMDYSDICRIDKPTWYNPNNIRRVGNMPYDKGIFDISMIKMKYNPASSIQLKKHVRFKNTFFNCSCFMCVITQNNVPEVSAPGYPSSLVRSHRIRPTQPIHQKGWIAHTRRNLMNIIIFMVTVACMFESFNEISNQSSFVKMKIHWFFLFIFDRS